MRSGDGNDTLNGGVGNDIMLAGQGDDISVAGRGNDIIYTGGGKDRISVLTNISKNETIKVKDLKVGQDTISLNLDEGSKKMFQQQGVINAKGEINWNKFPKPSVMVSDDFINKKSITTYTYQIGQTSIAIVADKSFKPQEVFSYTPTVV